MDKLDDQPQRDWYAAAAVEPGWSRNVLQQQVMNQLHRRVGAAPSNFAAQLSAGDSELAQQLTRDPSVLEFLDLTGPVREHVLTGQVIGSCHPQHRHEESTPTSSSWLNLVEPWFRELTDKALRRDVFRSVPPFVWTATADQILAKVAR